MPYSKVRIIFEVIRQDVVEKSLDYFHFEDIPKLDCLTIYERISSSNTL